MNCPSCVSHRIIKNAINATGKQNYKCKTCGRQFALDPLKSPIGKTTKESTDRLLLERISLAGIARATGVSPSRLQAKIVDMALNGSGVRDTARVLGVSQATVIKELKKRGGTRVREQKISRSAESQ